MEEGMMEGGREGRGRERGRRGWREEGVEGGRMMEGGRMIEGGREGGWREEGWREGEKLEALWITWMLEQLSRRGPVHWYF